ncbi:MAG: DUF2029 domain-containing protein [Nitrospirae bacterium]|nr:DUF2029 domain-containing protein [Nitrospirota bacterium]
MKFDTDIKKIFLFGLFLRFLFMPFTGFLQDVGNINYVSHIFATGHFNVYRYLGERLASGPLTIAGYPIFTIEDAWGYFPFGFVILGTFHWLFLPLLPGFDGEKWLEGYYAFRAVFLAKVPYLIFDIAIGWLLYKYFKDRDDATSFEQKDRAAFAFKLWWLNPVVIFTSYIFGQIDVMMTFFTFSGVYLAERYKKPYSGSVLLGLGGLIKTIPMFALPFLSFSPGLTGRKKIIAFLIGIGVLFLGILPFVGYEPFRTQILFSHHSDRLFALNFTPWGSKDTTYIFMLCYALLFLWYVIKDKERKLNLIEVNLILFAILFIVVNFHPQWFLWIIPFIIIVSVERGYTHLLKYLYIFFFLTILQWKFELEYFKLMAPVFTWAQRSLFDMIGLFYNSQQFVNISRSTLSGILIFLIIVTLMRKTSAYINNPVKIGLGFRSKLILVLSLIGVTAVIFYPFKVRSEKVVQQSFDTVVGLDSRPVMQTFLAEGKEIRKILIDTRMVDIPYQKRYDIDVEILDGNGNVVAKNIIKTRDLSGDSWIPVPFKGLHVEKGGRYAIKVYASTPVKEHSLFIKYSSKDVYHGGEMFSDGEGTGGDLAFRVVDQNQMKVSDEFYPRLLKDKPFIIIYSIIMAGMFVAILR